MADVTQKRGVSPTGIVGTVLGGTALAAIASNNNNGGGILPALFGNGNNNNCGCNGNNCGCNGFHGGYPVTFGANVDLTPFVSKYEMTLIQNNSSKDAVIAKLEAEKDAGAQITGALAPVYGMLNEQSKEICELKAGLAMETERRACGDEKLFSYVNSNFIKAEKSINSKKINYHGVKPVLEIDDCCCDEE